MNCPPMNTTRPGTPLTSTSVEFRIDSIRVQGPARFRLSKRFGEEMASVLSTQPQSEEGIARISMATDIGTRRRIEDSAVAMLAHLGDDDIVVPVILVGVADGIGGANDGNLAGAIAIQVLTESIVDEMVYRENRQLNRLLATSNIEAMLRASAGMAHNAIKTETNGGGTTLTCALIVNGMTYLAHAGDSRAYLIDTQRKRIELLTRDHRLVNAWQAHGVLTAEQALHHPYRHVLDRWLGKTGQFDIDLMRLEPMSSGWLLLCTDGVSDVLGQNEIYAIVEQSQQPGEACTRLVNAAIAHNTHDDLATVMVEIGS